MIFGNYVKNSICLKTFGKNSFHIFTTAFLFKTILFVAQFFSLVARLAQISTKQISIEITKTFTEDWVSKQSFFVLILTTA